MPVKPELCIWTFASGCNNAGEVTGYYRSGIPPGITIWRLNKSAGGKAGWGFACSTWPDKTGWDATRSGACFWTAAKVLQRGSPLFVDSGAYAESDESAPPLNERQWDIVMASTELLSVFDGVKPSLLWSVMPDTVGSQRDTMAKIRTYRKVIRRLVKRGVRCIVVLHKGRRSLADFAQEVASMLGTTSLVLGFPVVGGRTSPDEVVGALSNLRWKPLGVHLLGISPESPTWFEYSEALGRLPHGLELACDAVMHRRLVSRTEGRGPLTQELDIAGKLLVEHLNSGAEDYHDPLLRPVFHWGAELADPGRWLSQGGRRRIWREAVGYKMDPEAFRASAGSSMVQGMCGSVQCELFPAGGSVATFEELWLADPTAALPLWLGVNYENKKAVGWLMPRLLDAYRQGFTRHTTAMRKDQALRRYFTGWRPDTLLYPFEVAPMRPKCFVPPRRAQLELFPAGSAV